MNTDEEDAITLLSSVRGRLSGSEMDALERIAEGLEEYCEEDDEDFDDYRIARREAESAREEADTKEAEADEIKAMMERRRAELETRNEKREGNSNPEPAPHRICGTCLMSATKEKKLTRSAMLKKHGIHVAMTCALDLAEVFPGPVRDGTIPRRYMLALARKGWIAPISNPKDMGELPDYEITVKGAEAVDKIKAAEVEYQQQRKDRGARTVPQ